MIDLYSFPTPNGRKVHIMLEETGLSYSPHLTDITRGEQFDDDFLAISPGNKIPAIVDRDGPDGKDHPVFESGAILIYLAEKAGMLLPADNATRSRTLQWLMFQMGGIGPMFGQANHFRSYAPEHIPYAHDRYTNEVRRLLGVLDSRLETAAYLAGENYTIADVATWPWVFGSDVRRESPERWPNVNRWLSAIEQRPAVERGREVLKDAAKDAQMDDEAKEALFGATQYRRR